VVVIVTVLQWMRLAQNLRKYRDTGLRFPYLFNACKFGFVLLVVLFSYANPTLSKAGKTPGLKPVQIVWVMLFIIATMWSFMWDVFMGWGLGKRSHRMLREVLMLKKPWKYYGAIIADFFLKFLWMYQLIPQNFLPYWLTSNSSIYEYAALTIIAVLELCRRFMWAVFR
jgi:hypothetical protein